MQKGWRQRSYSRLQKQHGCPCHNNGRAAVLVSVRARKFGALAYCDELVLVVVLVLVVLVLVVLVYIWYVWYVFMVVLVVLVL